MKNKIVGIFLTGILLMPLMASQSALLPELNRPSFIEADQNRLYIVDGTSVFIYSLKDFKLEKKFGRKGEGPQEFKYISSLSLSKDIILVNGRNKVAFYTTEGTFKNEIKVTGGSDFVRIGNRFIGVDMARVYKISNMIINLYDGNLKKIKEISRHKGLFLGSNHLDPILIFGPLGPECSEWNGNFLIKSGKENFKLLDANGVLLFSLSVEHEKMALRAEHRKNILDFYSTDPRTKRNFPALKKKFKFPDYFPSIRDYKTDGYYLYILTFSTKMETMDSDKEILVYDSDGKLLKSLFLPVKEANIMEIYPFTIKNNRLYQLVEDEEEWKLVITDLK